MELPLITLIYKTHKGKPIIGFKTIFNAGLITIFKKNNFKWSQSNKFWYIANTSKNQKSIPLLFKGNAVLKNEESIGKNQIHLLFKNTSNVKHKCIFMVIYTTGLKVQQVVNVRKQDVRLDEKYIHVRADNEREPKVIPIDALAINILKDYLQLYKPTYWLFEGLGGKAKYSTGSINALLKRISKNASIPIISVETLRNSSKLNE